MKIWIFHGDRKTDIKVWSQESLVIWTAANNSSGLEGGTLGMTANSGGWTPRREQGDVCSCITLEACESTEESMVQTSVEMVSVKRSGQRMPQRTGEPRKVSWNSRLFSPEQGNDDFWDRRKADKVAGFKCCGRRATMTSVFDVLILRGTIQLWKMWQLLGHVELPPVRQGNHSLLLVKPRVTFN